MYILVQKGIDMNITNNTISCRSTFDNATFYLFKDEVLSYLSS